MSAVATLLPTRPPHPATRARWAAAHPGWWLWAGSAVAWVVLAVAALAGTDHHAATGHHAGSMASMGHDVGSHGGAARPAVVDAGWVGHWLVMVVAMMWPLLTLQAAAVRRRTRPAWRGPAVAALLGAYTAAWLAVGLVAHAVTAVALPPGWSRAWLVGWLAAAAVAAGSTWRVRALRACGRLRTIAPAGRRSLVTAARAGAWAWRPCAVLCGPVMAAMVVPHPLWVLVAVSAVVWYEQRHALGWRHPLPPVALGCVAVAALVVP